MTTYLNSLSNHRNLSLSEMNQIAVSLVPAQFRERPWKNTGNHGKSLLQTEEQMNCYMAAYCEMHIMKVKETLKNFPFDELPDKIRIIDYGCGQGIATLSFLEELQNRKMLQKVFSIFLVEPSPYTLARAEANVRNFTYGMDISVCSINKYLPSDGDSSKSVTEADLFPKSSVVVHIFSNILDIPEINLKKTAELVLSSGSTNYLLCMGPIDRNSPRIDEFCSIFNDGRFFSKIDNPSLGKVNNSHNVQCKSRGMIVESSSGINDYLSSGVYTDDGVFDEYDQRSSLYSLEDNEKIAVMIVGYQLLVSAKCCPLDESDNPSIDIILG